jgi:hypothetical protein
VHKFVAKRLLGELILLTAEPNDPVLENEGYKGIYTCDQSIYAQVPFVPLNQVGIVNVLLHNCLMVNLLKLFPILQ